MNSLTFSPSGAIVLASGLGIAPALFWLWYFYRKDNYEPEPQKLIFRAFLLGMVAVVPAAAIELFVNLFLPFLRVSAQPNLERTDIIILAVGMFLVVGPVEEIAKYLTVRTTIYKHPEFNEVMDGVIYSSSTALGFAALENVVYIATGIMDEGFGGGLGTAAVRAILATPAHVAFSATWGYYLGMYKMRATLGIASLSERTVWKGIIYASLMHGAWDFIIFYGSTLGYIYFVPFSIMVFLIFRSLSRRIKAAQDASPFKERSGESLSDE